MKKLLPILSLLLIVSCGKTTIEDNNGEEVTIVTVKEEIEEVEEEVEEVVEEVERIYTLTEINDLYDTCLVEEDSEGFGCGQLKTICEEGETKACLKFATAVVAINKIKADRIQAERDRVTAERLSNIEDCLKGDKPACDRAASQGFTNAPIFFEDIVAEEIQTINYNGMELQLHAIAEGDSLAVFKGSFTVRFNNRDYRSDVYLHLNEDYETWTDVLVTGFGLSHARLTSNSVLPHGVSQSWRNLFGNWPEKMNLGVQEWKSLDANSIYIGAEKSRIGK